MRLLSLLILCTSLTFSQTAPKFAKYDVSDSGFKIYLPANPDPVDVTYSPDSSKVYTIECIDSTTGTYFHFGAICINLKGINDANTDDELLINYMNYLKEAFIIKEAAGYGKGHTLENYPTVKGVIDYWKDEEGDQWQLAGWVSESSLAVMFMYGPKEYPNDNVWQIFKKGIRFPENK